MDYSETLNWMFSRLPMFQRQGGPALKKDLTNIKAFSEVLGDPHNNFPSIHVAGTNGKGSTSHMLSSVLMEAGYRVGLYTSPHLKDFRERISVNGDMIPQEEVVEFIGRHKTFLEQQGLSFFEMSVGMAFAYFEKTAVDIAVIEVGLGGRLDSTNILKPICTAITNIGLDHTQFLGETLVEIAGEKAGIIKTGIPIVIGEYQEEVQRVFERISAERKAPLYRAFESELPTYESDLKGSYQRKNMRTALAVIKILEQQSYEISHEALVNGFARVVQNTGLKGRYQILRAKPKVICDTAHNREGIELVLEQIQREPYRELHLVLGMVKEKDLKEILSLYPQEAHYYFCQPAVPRGLDKDELKRAAGDQGLTGKAYDSVDAAYQNALNSAQEDDLIFVGGSTFVVAEMPI